MEINSSQYVPCDTSCIGEWPSCPQDPQLALAYVPYQKADKVYRPKDALRQGTIFPELYMPYMEVPSENLHDEDSLLYELMAHDFTLIDCELYLDTHPNDTRALKLYKECKQKRDTIRQKIRGGIRTISTRRCPYRRLFMDLGMQPMAMGVQRK